MTHDELAEPLRHRRFPRPRPATADPSLEYRGWAQVGVVDDIRRRGAVVVRRFGRDVVVWTDGSGTLRAMESTVPDDGDGDSDSDGDGSAGAPYRAVPVTDLCGFALMYHWAPGDDRRAPPPPIPESSEIVSTLREDRTRRTMYRVTFPTTILDMAENSADRAHFAVLHRTTVHHANPVVVDARPDGSMEVDTTLRVWLVPGIVTDSRTVMTYADPFTCRTRFYNLGRRTDLVALAGPTGEHTVEMIFVGISPATLGWFGRVVHAATVRRGRLLVYEDRRILSTRTFPERPNLSDFDGPLFAVRRWMESHRGSIGAHRRPARDHLVGASASR